MGRSEREGEQGGSKRRDSAGKAKKKKAKKRRAEAQDDGAPAALNAADGGAAARPLPPAAPQERLLAAAGSHDSDSTTSQQDGAPGATGGADEAAPATAAAPAGPAAEGGGARKRAGKAAPVLPWMRVPIAIEASEGTLLEEVQGLDPRLRRALEGTGIEVLFPVQTVAWRETAGGASPAHDICICAPTGSGKTLSYALPVLQALSGRAVPRLRALVVLPTRDLAVQVFGVLAGLCPALGLAACLAAGKASLAAEAQLLASGGVDILVATPGRLIAHLEGTPGFTLRHLRFLVIDRLGLHCPRYIAMSAVDHRYQLPRSLQELKLVVPAERKPAALAALLQELRGEQTIVFTSSVEATHRLHLLLAALPCLPDRAVEFSSLVAPAERAARLEAFRSGKAKVLVCSDAMTRGMDVAGVANVVNYDAPVYVKTYVHRAGRTARAGRAGRVFTLLRHEDVRHFKGMLRKADNTFVRAHRLAKGALEAVRDDVDAALEAMGAALAAEAEAERARGGAAGPAAAVAPAVAKEAATAATGVVAEGQAARAAGGQQRAWGGGRGAPKRRKVSEAPEFSLLPPAP
ncbi:hypothetical protein CHLNCDRAFT_138879 [Chlorella variabilis]|uniref:RNA helicase n=1 Tax=Chlorella variabilis TaxID=554065 RepID=E1ZNU6_CHLVA|nr:hypothetical protein CHLNCDRAFT_138879 [Chlorella variabilis]EFN52499.1 hypothetical protein CHLNCDRAFT_138879 [Chlorella variabilis]|eukprot:XP_005844601.1 hypothetical protein CHLNCDRAFT_138879 [Chlorella variabilis]